MKDFAKFNTKCIQCILEQERFDLEKDCSKCKFNKEEKDCSKCESNKEEE